jgi:hypothetical protein
MGNLEYLGQVKAGAKNKRVLLKDVEDNRLYTSVVPVDVMFSLGDVFNRYLDLGAKLDVAKEKQVYSVVLGTSSSAQIRREVIL